MNLKYTFQKFFVVACAVLCLSVAAPCALAEAPTPTSTPTNSAGDMAADMGTAVEEYGGGISDAFDSVLEGWDTAISGPLQVGLFFGSVFSDLYQAAPPFLVYTILLCVCVAVFAVIKALTN